jgi:signal transduction histidine kinase
MSDDAAHATGIVDSMGLRAGEEHPRIIAKTAPFLIWTSGTNEEIAHLHQPWFDCAEPRSNTAVETTVATVLCTDEAERCREVYQKAFQQRKPFELECRLGRHDGEYRWVVLAGVPRYNETGSFTGYIGASIDITDRKLAEDVLFGQKLIEAHEEESRRIARELHDDISQSLALVSMRLDYLNDASPASATEFQQEIGELRQEIADLGADIQAVSRRLHPAKLENLGLEKAAAAFCEEFSKRYGVTIDVHFENIPTALPREISLSLFRVLQEALQNIVKHSGSPRAKVSLSGHTDTIHLTVKDSGAGFDPHEATTGPGLGMTSMKERLRGVRGQLRIHSKRGNGTIIHAIAPLGFPTNRQFSHVTASGRSEVTTHTIEPVKS